MKAQYLAELLDGRFNLEEIDLIARHLGIDPENIPGTTRLVRATHLIDKLARDQELVGLFQEVSERKPNVSLGPYFHELLTARFLTNVPDLETLFLDLGLSIREFTGPIKIKSRKLQECMVQLGRWEDLLRTYADYDDTVDFIQLQRLFPFETSSGLGIQQRKQESQENIDMTAFLPFLQLNFSSQNTEFGAASQSSIGAYVLYGQPSVRNQDISLRLLLKQLLNWVIETEPARNLTNNRQDQPVLIPIKPTCVTLASNAIWRGIADRLGEKLLNFYPSQDDQKQIVNKVNQRLTKSDFIVVVEALDDKLISHILSDFWLPFARYLKEVRQEDEQEHFEANGRVAPLEEQRRYSRLLVFLMDNQGMLSPEAVDGMDLETYAPVELPRVVPFIRQHLNDWTLTAIRHPYAGRLKSLLTKQDWTDEMLTDLGGVQEVEPDIALYYLCQKCEYNYEEGFVKWLKPHA